MKTIKNIMILLQISFLLLVVPSVCSMEEDLSLIPNGSLEKGDPFPVKWLIPDGDNARFIPSGPFHGRVLNLFNEDQDSTGTVLYETSVYPLEAVGDVLLQFDYKSQKTGIIVEVRGYGPVRGENEIVYRRKADIDFNGSGWQRFQIILCPRCRYYKVEALQIVFISKQSPSNIYLDNFKLAPISD